MANLGDVREIQGIGSVYYKYAWISECQVKWWGEKEIPIKLIFSAGRGDDITDAQKRSFTAYQKEIRKIISGGLGVLISFIKDDYGLDVTQDEVFKVLTPVSILFRESGVWGILFDADFDVEGGVAFYQKGKNGEFYAGGQDAFL